MPATVFDEPDLSIETAERIHVRSIVGPLGGQSYRPHRCHFPRGFAAGNNRCIVTASTIRASWPTNSRALPRSTPAGTTVQHRRDPFWRYVPRTTAQPRHHQRPRHEQPNERSRCECRGTTHVTFTGWPPTCLAWRSDRTRSFDTAQLIENLTSAVVGMRKSPRSDAQSRPRI